MQIAQIPRAHILASVMLDLPETVKPAVVRDKLKHQPAKKQTNKQTHFQTNKGNDSFFISLKIAG